MAKGRRLHSWDISPIQMALLHGIIPVVAGDVIFDQALGGTIFSTEELFHYLAEKLRPTRILLAGLDQGVYQDPQHPENIIPQITPALIDEIEPVLQGSASADVTGGMLSKVQWMLSLVTKLPQLKVQIFSGAEPGNIQKALAGVELGTIISY
jgi:isopentenyl phosphate kinase